MVELVVVGIVAGFLAGISPCILPVLPIVPVAGASGASLPAGDETPTRADAPVRVPRAGPARSLAVAGGLILSFSIIVLAGSELLSLLHLPQDARPYQFPASLPLGALRLAGTWTDHAEEATAGAGAQLELHFLAQDVYLVLGGTLDVWVGGQHTQTIHVGGTPRLYTLYQAGSATAGTLTLRASPGSRRTTSPSARPPSRGGRGWGGRCLARPPPRAIRRRSGRPGWRAGRAAGRRWC